MIGTSSLSFRQLPRLPSPSSAHHLQSASPTVISAISTDPSLFPDLTIFLSSRLFIGIINHRQIPQWSIITFPPVDPGFINFPDLCQNTLSTNMGVVGKTMVVCQSPGIDRLLLSVIVRVYFMYEFCLVWN